MIAAGPPRKRTSRSAAATDVQHSAQTRVTQLRAATNTELVHELEVHQAELEMQNEELRVAQLELATARDRYVDLYDFAPVGYFTLDAEGRVTQANLTGATMLKTTRKSLLGRGFSRFVVSAQADNWYLFLRQAWQSKSPQRTELALSRQSGEIFHGQLDGAPDMPSNGAPTLRLTLTDVSQRKQAEMDRQMAQSAQDAREAERRHVARELHEGLGQRLSALKMELANLPLNADSVSARQRVAAMLESLDDAVASVRRIATDLRPLMLDDLGLAAALDWLVHDLGRRRSLTVRLDLPELDPPPDDHTSVAMYRVAQVILEQVSRADEIDGLAVSMAQKRGELMLKVHCRARAGVVDRAGHAPAGWPQRFQSLPDHARALGARLEIDDTPKAGPSILAAMPMRRLGDVRQAPERRSQSNDRRRQGNLR